MEEMIQKLLLEWELVQAEQYIAEQQDNTAEAIILKSLFRIFHMEVDKGEQKTVFDYSLRIDELVHHYIKLKLLLRRLEFDLPSDKQHELYTYCKMCCVSKYFLTIIVLTNIFDRAKVCRRIIQLFENGDADDKNIAEHFRGVLQYVRQ